MQDLDEHILNKLYNDLVERGHRHGSVINKVHNDKAQILYGIYTIEVSESYRYIIIVGKWWGDEHCSHNALLPHRGSALDQKKVEINEHTADIISNIISRWDVVIEEHNKSNTVPRY